MTFEEFFAKKKIDLAQLERADPALYSEFKTHFAQMGEKSFDHSKKFWFNKLRHLYHLTEAPKETAKQPEASIASQSEALSSPTIEQTAPVSKVSGFKPRFKAPAVKKEPDVAAGAEKTAEEAEPALPLKNKAPFKPRNVKPVSAAPSEDSQNVESRPGQTEASDTPTPALPGNNGPQPAYKPRFAARNLSTAPSEATGEAGYIVKEQDERKHEEAGPGFPKEQDKLKDAQEAGPDVPNEREQPTMPDIPSDQNKRGDAQEAEPDVPNEREQEAIPDIPEKPKEEPAGSNRPAYKPRFNVKNMKPQTPEPKTEPPGRSQEENKEVSEKNRNALPEPDASHEEHEGAKVASSEQTANKQAAEADKPAYKPRFNIKNMKPKSDHDQ